MSSCLIVISDVAGTTTGFAAVPPFQTDIFASSGRNLPTGSLSVSLPSSMSIITATLVTILVYPVHPHDRVAGHRRPRVAIAQAGDVDVDDSAMTGDERDGAGEFAAIDLLPEHRVHSGQPLGRKTLNFRRRGRQWLRGCARGRAEDQAEHHAQQFAAHGQ